MLKAALRHAAEARLVVGAAAVADWRPARVSKRKLKKSKSSPSLLLRLRQNPDILKTLSRRRKGPWPRLVGFALETENWLENARRKLRSKGLEFIVANSPQALDRDSIQAHLVYRSGRVRKFQGSKAHLARRILEEAMLREP
jgi:phosphopantothenoylcysteine decarboxylase/phosphopantothenate--cysteine ligase